MTSEWKISNVADKAYCDHGQHFVTGGRVWKFWARPALYTRVVCEDCAEALTEED
ncbi:MAG: hypothetical protein H0U46_03140 [Actinobacteria bacterium]|nr:hypothetical protein [Actinomycetota bacterium]